MSRLHVQAYSRLSMGEPLRERMIAFGRDGDLSSSGDPWRRISRQTIVGICLPLGERDFELLQISF